VERLQGKELGHTEAVTCRHPGTCPSCHSFLGFLHSFQLPGYSVQCLRKHRRV